MMESLSSPLSSLSLSFSSLFHSNSTDFSMAFSTRSSPSSPSPSPSGRRHVLLIALVAFLVTLMGSQGLAANLQSNVYIPVYVMLPLDTITHENVLNDPNALHGKLTQLKEANVDGVMVDVWWGLVERAGSRQYEWNAYEQLFEMIAQVGLKVEATMSFHRCGLSVGDTCNVTIPHFVSSVGKEVFYLDQHGNTDYDYLSWGVDEENIFEGRSAIGIYSDFMQNFAYTFKKYLGSTISEIQIGMGPAGELRYPAYKLTTYPGVGEFQVYDPYIRRDLQNAAAAAGHPDWGKSGPSNAGTYQDLPDQTGFFNANSPSDTYKSAYGAWFLKWYQQGLLTHGDKVLAAAKNAFSSSNVEIAAKVAGIHWQYKHPSHAAEVTAGYVNVNQNGYDEFAKLFAKYGATFIFTALEMRDSEQSNCNCGPSELVGQTLQAAKRNGIKYAGENALPRYDKQAYYQIAYEARRIGTIDGFTYLRLTDELLGEKFNDFKFLLYLLHGQ